MKTIETLDMEKTLYAYCREQGDCAVEEVTLPENQGIVDTLSLSSDNQFTCFELKVTKTDFHSKAKLSFIGHYNYFVLPRHLLAEVQEEVPETVGILVFDYYDQALWHSRRLILPGELTLQKKAVRCSLGVPESKLTQRFLHSLNREVDKAKRLENGLKNYNSDQLLEELVKRQANNRLDTLTQNAYHRFETDIAQAQVNAQQAEIDALKAENRQQAQSLWNLSQHQPKLPDSETSHDL